MTSKEFKEKFELPFGEFIQVTEFQDGTGFSFAQKHKDNFESLYKVGFKENQTNETRKSLWANVSYGHKTDGGIILGSGKNGLRDPVDLNFHDEYSYDSVTGIFYDRDKEIKPKQILIDIQRVHMLPTRKVRGCWLRTRLHFWRTFLPGVIKSIDWVLVWVLWLVSGESLESDTMGRYFAERRTERRDSRMSVVTPPEQGVKFKEANTVNFFGYDAKRQSVVFYCLLHLIAYVILFYGEYRVSLMSHIIRNTFLALCYVIVSFSITEWLLPRFLKFLIGKMPSLLAKVAFKSVRIWT